MTKTIHITIKPVAAGYAIMTEAYNNDKPHDSAMPSLQYILDTLPKAKDLRDVLIVAHNNSERISPSRVSREAIVA